MLSDFRNPLSKRNFTLFGLWLIHFYWFKHILEDKEGCLICYLAQIFGRNKNRNVKKWGMLRNSDLVAICMISYNPNVFSDVNENTYKAFCCVQQKRKYENPNRISILIRLVTEKEINICVIYFFGQQQMEEREIHTSSNLSERIFYS